MNLVARLHVLSCRSAMRTDVFMVPPESCRHVTRTSDVPKLTLILEAVRYTEEFDHAYIGPCPIYQYGTAHISRTSRPPARDPSGRSAAE